MTTDRTAELKRLKARQHMQRHRLRKAGLLPPLPRCPQCDAKITTDRWLPLCSRCTHQARPIRLMAEEIIRELRQEARAEAPT